MVRKILRRCRRFGCLPVSNLRLPKVSIAAKSGPLHSSRDDERRVFGIKPIRARLTMRVLSYDPTEGNATDAIWLRCRDYYVTPLNAGLRRHIPELEYAIHRGISGCPDRQRRDFYTVELRGGWAYIHVREKTKTVYLVAYCSNSRASSETIEGNFFRPACGL